MAPPALCERARSDVTNSDTTAPQAETSGSQAGEASRPAKLTTTLPSSQGKQARRTLSPLIAPERLADVGYRSDSGTDIVASGGSAGVDATLVYRRPSTIGREVGPGFRRRERDGRPANADAPGTSSVRLKSATGSVDSSSARLGLEIPWPVTMEAACSAISRQSAGSMRFQHAGRSSLRGLMLALTLEGKLEHRAPRTGRSLIETVPSSRVLVAL